MALTRMAAIGSSFAAGPGIGPAADAAAMRSERNYPHLVAEALGASLVDATVSGATTETILRTAQRTRRHRFAPQVEAIDPRLDVDLVTITAGGNDIGYLSFVLRAAIAHRLSGRAVTAAIGHRIRPAGGTPGGGGAGERVTANLVAVVEAVAKRAPHARILLVDYLTIVGPETRVSPRVPFTASDLDRIRETAAALAEAFVLAERRSAAELVRVSGLSASHAFDAEHPWVNGLRPIRQLSSSFHPNAAGMRAVSDAVLRHLGHAAGGTRTPLR